MLSSPFDAPRIAPGSHVTLHYRLAVVVDGAEREVVSTFDSQPATLTVGAGQIADALEARLLGLAEGARQRFELAAEEGFGARSADLVQALPSAVYEASAGADADHRPGDVVRFAGPGGREFTGVLKQRDDERVVIDFNHPLAGLPVRFAVHVVGVL